MNYTTPGSISIFRNDWNECILEVSAEIDKNTDSVNFNSITVVECEGEDFKPGEDVKEILKYSQLRELALDFIENNNN